MINIAQKNKVKTIALSVFLLAVFFGYNIVAPLAAGAEDSKSSGIKGLMDSAAKQGGYKEVGSGGELKQFLQMAGNFINLFLSLLGVVFVCLAVYAGYLWMTAAGEEEKVKKAKEILQNAVIGVILVSSVYVISYFVLAKFAPVGLENGGGFGGGQSGGG